MRILFLIAIAMAVTACSTQSLNHFAKGFCNRDTNCYRADDPRIPPRFDNQIPYDKAIERGLIGGQGAPNPDRVQPDAFGQWPN